MAAPATIFHPIPPHPVPAQAPAAAAPIGTRFLAQITGNLLTALQRRLLTLGYQGPAPPVPGQWRYVKFLGKGGESINYLYVYTDLNNNVVDRVVQRNVIMGTRRFNRVPYLWDWRNRNRGVVPAEQYIMNMFTNEPNVIGIRGCTVDQAHARCALYIDWAEYGTLGELIDHHRRTGSGRWGRGKTYRQRAPFEEQWLWYLFRSLIMGLVAIQSGAEAQPPYRFKPATAPWEVVHGDLHPGNVFLGKEDATQFRIYPTPKIADFGGAQLTYAGDIHNRFAFRYMARRGEFAPPELKINNVPHHEWRSNAYPEALTAANVCQVGLIMLACMRLEDDAPPVVWTSPTVNNNDLAATYSADLRDLVRSCLWEDPAQRPTPRALLRQIQSQGLPHFRDVRGLTFSRKPGNHKRKLRVSMAEDYKIGFKFRRPAKRR